MADTWETLKDYIRVDGDADDTFIERCFNDAVETVADYVGDKYVPQWRIDACVLIVGRDMYAARDAPQGVSQFSDVNDNPIRVARDWLSGVRPQLRKYVTGIA
jgi:hypothetical protein